MIVTENPPRWQLILAFIAVYVIWGSSYLAIIFAIETIPPFLMAGTRFVFAGVILIGWAKWRGAPAPTRANWRAAILTGALMFLVANGAVVWAEQYVPSSITALLNALIPVWMVLADWLVYRTARPGLAIFSGLALGFVGVVLLIGPGLGASGTAVNLPGALVLVLGAVSWSVGSLISRQADLPKSPTMATGIQVLAGGTMLLILSTLSGELADFQLAQVSVRSLLAMLYAMVFASIIAYSAYTWLLRVTTSARVSTYAYVNPVIAVSLGGLLNNETITGRTLLAAAIILSGVVIINTYRAQGEFNLRWWRRIPVAVKTR